jgi:regulatory protein
MPGRAARVGRGPGRAGAGRAGPGRAGRGQGRGADESDPDLGGPGPGPGQTGAAAGADPERRARELALRLLSSAPRTRAELAAALGRRGLPEAVITEVLSRFAEVGLIDDAAFARAWVESRHHGRGLARRALSAELKRRGIGGQEISAAVETLDPEQELATARRLAERGLAASRGRPLPVRMRRVVGLLARKGYPAPVAYRVAREVLEQEGADLSGTAVDFDDPALTSADDDIGTG